MNPSFLPSLKRRKKLH